MKAFRGGFTLVEVLVTVLILAVLAGLAIPTFFGAVERSRANEALTNLNVIFMGEKIHRLNNPAYWGPGATTIANANTNLGIDMTATYYTTISITQSNGGNTFTARLTRNAVAGGNSSKWFEIAYTNGSAVSPFPPTEGGAY